jgi:hypothetical protein
VRSSLLIWLLWGCADGQPVTGPAPTDSGDLDDTDTQRSWSWEGLAPIWSAEEVTDEISSALSYGLPRGEVLAGHILDLLSRGDELCPGHPMMISMPYTTLKGCTAQTEYSYRGILVYEDEVEEIAQQSVERRRQFTSTADFEIIHPTGEIFYGGGNFDYWRERSMESDIVIGGGALITGMWGDPLHEAEWMRSGISAYMTAIYELKQDGTEHWIRLDGTLGLGGHHLYFNDLQYSSEVCGDSPMGGELWIRQPDTSWYQLRFDSSCDCADLTWNQTDDLGEICVDTSVWMADVIRSLSGPF